jgi:hypothetical protein
MMLGREFADGDKNTAIINSTAARQLGLESHPLGSTVRLDGEPTARRILGVADDVRDGGVDRSPEPFVYLPVSDGYRGKFDDRTVFLAVRCSRACSEAADLVRQSKRT